MKGFFLGILAVLLIILLGIVGRGCAYANRVADVATEEVDPRTLLNRYEWFKNAAAALDAKRADIELYEKRETQLKADYGNKGRSEWSREDREQANVWSVEVAGAKASYNNLAAEYNANMAKFNYAFTNRGDLPKGATEVLPREVRAYVTQ